MNEPTHLSLMCGPLSWLEYQRQFREDEMQGSTRIPPLYWFARAELHGFLVQQKSNGVRLFPFFTTERYAEDYRDAHGIPSDYVVSGNDTKEYVLRVLDTVADGFDVYAIDPPLEIGATFPFYTLEDMKAYVQRKADEGIAW